MLGTIYGGKLIVYLQVITVFGNQYLNWKKIEKGMGTQSLAKMCVPET